MRSNLFKSVILSGLLLLLSSGATGRPPAADGPRRAPLNPDYEAYLSDQAGGLLRSFTDDGYPLGFIPPPVKLPTPRRPATASSARPAALPSSFDLRDHAGVTGVKNQGGCGSCWTFGTFGSLESHLLYKESAVWDFSEQHLNKKHGFDYKECAGGHEWMSTAYFARWSGPLDEARMPYPYSLPEGRVQAAPVSKHVQNVWFLPGRTGFTDNDVIKQALMDDGALYIAFYVTGACYNDLHAAYYFNGSAYANHAVTLIGWDDDFPAANFKTTPPGNGAFLLKNSWGADWGDGGYFWISYYDTVIGDFTQFFNAEPSTNYLKIYQYDPLGWYYSWGYGSETAYGANIFTAGGQSGNRIKAVGFYTPVENAQVEISIYNKVNARNPVSGTRVGATYATTVAHAGYNTVVLPTPCAVSAGKKFAVVVKFTTPGYNWPVATEDRISGYSSKAKAAFKQSFMSADGVNWEDVQTFDPKANVCLKAYAGK